uniref:Uncharacterized protein n=1 Tax=Aplanochytrium stocchinoi TaxID=215587 RepID=A0A7S3PE11_9STRA|mmetsp:Transcript_11069/g.12624  ORF Transcript_11069/g.12624 Transcript_11069/m.12624 type:complete len:315 (+) Transcript_11069:96-1040(+)|eukprot:CAMPEP_0204838120 /NCGR_PEP_ID=MMETSP1346-20131115/29921_1 /ASSEMBLY_ACC=CAM_ASM_000771 /TAXON_ID=215587 /ORGANISM="Aplanochytrium stocchinoi, Strain GSBS06" /LENGTH=314 /DNA_ID=CAMNT_0051973979 /DNA_START=28 /DNA_END=972 /DNA_ORIENTATION=-
MAANGVTTLNLGRPVKGTIGYANSDDPLSSGGSGLEQGGHSMPGTPKMKKENVSIMETINKKTMDIYDIRPAMNQISLDKNGFCVGHLQTNLEETLDILFEDGDKQIRKIYWPEVEELVRNTVTMDGRKPKYVFSIGTQKFCEDKTRGPFTTYSRTAHTDFAEVVFDKAWKMLTKRGVPEEEAKKMDLMFVNTWKPFGRPCVDNPLTILDWETVDPSRDVHGLKRGSPTKYMSIYNTTVTYNPQHKWVYIPEMQSDEVWVFKQVDSRPNKLGLAKHAFHTSFRMPDHQSDVNRTRRSIAVRLICAFEPVPKASL